MQPQPSRTTRSTRSDTGGIVGQLSVAQLRNNLALLNLRANIHIQPLQPARLQANNVDQIFRFHNSRIRGVRLILPTVIRATPTAPALARLEDETVGRSCQAPQATSIIIPAAINRIQMTRRLKSKG